MEILKSKEDPWDLFRDLLKLICERFPAEDPGQDGGTFVKVRCSCRSQESSAVSVSPHGFLLLEAAEASMGSTEQNLELVVVDKLGDHLLSAVGSRLTRQEGVDTRVVVRKAILCQGEESASAISSLMQHCGKVEVLGYLQVLQDIGKEGWTALREALSGKLHDILHIDTGRKSFMRSARREDLKDIWDCLSVSWRFMGDHEVFHKQRGEEGWAALEQFLDLTGEEWRAAKRAMGGSIHNGFHQPQVMFVNDQEVYFPGVDMDTVGLVGVHFGGQLGVVEAQMMQPGGQGLLMALQSAASRIPRPQVDEVVEGQVPVEDAEDNGNQ